MLAVTSSFTGLSSSIFSSLLYTLLVLGQHVSLLLKIIRQTITEKQRSVPAEFPLLVRSTWITNVGSPRSTAHHGLVAFRECAQPLTVCRLPSLAKIALWEPSRSVNVLTWYDRLFSATFRRYWLSTVQKHNHFVQRYWPPAVKKYGTNWPTYAEYQCQNNLQEPKSYLHTHRPFYVSCHTNF